MIESLGPERRLTVPEWEDGLHVLMRNDEAMAMKRGRIQTTITGLAVDGQVAGSKELVVTANPRELPA